MGGWNMRMDVFAGRANINNSVLLRQLYKLINIYFLNSHKAQTYTKGLNPKKVVYEL